MWTARVLKRPVDKDNAPSLCQAESKRFSPGFNRSFVTLAHHLRLVATNSYHVLQPPPLVRDALLGRILLPWTGRGLSFRIDGVCEFRWANKKGHPGWVALC